MAAAADPLLGTEVRRFKLTRLIGRGGMGRVYEGVHEQIGSRVAVKVIAEEFAQDADHAERFFAEARAVNMIHHDGIVNVFDLDRLPDGRPVIVMEYVEGETLRKAMEAGPLPLGGVVVVVAQVLDALAAAHAIGVVHRDLKPDNIMIMPSGRTKVLDFGIAKLLKTVDGAPAPRTRTGALIGTPEYMAPEQIDGGVADARSDLYAMGIVLYEAITGRRPFEGPSDYAIMRAHVEKPVPSLRSVRPDVPAELEQVIMTALAKRSQDRYRSARAMSNGLAHAVLKLPENQWRPLIPNGPVLRGAVSIPPSDAPTDPSPGESLPTSPRIKLPEATETARQTPRGRDPDYEALRAGLRNGEVEFDPLNSGHHTAAPVRPRRESENSATPPPAAIPASGARTLPPIDPPANRDDSPPSESRRRGRRPSRSKRETRPSDPPPPPSNRRPSDSGVAARPSEPTVAEAAQSVPRRSRRAVFAVWAIGIAVAVSAAAIAIIKSRSSAPTAPARDAAIVEPLVAPIDAMIKVEGARGGVVLDAMIDVVETSSAADDKPKAKKRAVDAGSLVADKGAASIEPPAPKPELASDPTPTPTPKPKTDPWQGPIPDKYKAIPGITIDSSKSDLLTVARVRLEQPLADLSKIELVRYVATAQQLARKFESDAELTQIHAFVNRDGTLAHGPQYYFVSKQALASKDNGRLACISVNVQPWGKPIVVVNWSAQTDCDKWPSAHTPKCSLGDVAKRFPADSSEKVILHYDVKGWRVGHSSNGAIIAEVPDDC